MKADSDATGLAEFRRQCNAASRVQLAKIVVRAGEQLTLAARDPNTVVAETTFRSYWNMLRDLVNGTVDP